jgi:hypothetical protein
MGMGTGFSIGGGRRGCCSGVYLRQHPWLPLLLGGQHPPDRGDQNTGGQDDRHRTMGLSISTSLPITMQTYDVFTGRA